MIHVVEYKAKLSLFADDNFKERLLINFSFLLQMTWKLLGMFVTLLVVPARADPVYILSENMQQMITSTSLQWMPADKYSKIDFQDAVIGAHQDVEGKCFFLIYFDPG